jgi:hypothetical protein
MSVTNEVNFKVGPLLTQLLFLEKRIEETLKQQSVSPSPEIAQKLEDSVTDYLAHSGYRFVNLSE